MSAEQRLKERGIVLPDLPSPKGTYVPANLHNGVLYLSGQGPLLENGEFACGLVGRDFTVEQAYQHARRTGLVLLSAARAELGRAQRRVQGYYASDDALAGQIAARDADVAGADVEGVGGAGGRGRAEGDG